MLAAGLFMTGCSADSSRSDAASALLSDARSKVSAKDYKAAMVLLDTLDKSYRDCLEQRRAGTRLRTEALRDLTIDSIAANDARRQRLQQHITELEPRFRHIDIDGTGGFLVDRSIYTGDEMSHTGIQPRIDDDGIFFVAVNLSGRTIGITGLKVGEVASQPVTWESPVVEGSEIMNIGSEYLHDFAETVADTDKAPLTVEITGRRGTVPVRLDSRQLEAFRATWEYSRALTAMRSALISRERLERQLHNLRDALANLPETETAE
ncbi:MAG: hypothetical protein Q4C34_03820 [Bacteroidales bacterium]|nr:hypothetical protein [Bacteroidales bacterium]